jgi:hypothetical protein
MQSPTQYESNNVTWLEEGDSIFDSPNSLISAVEVVRGQRRHRRIVGCARLSHIGRPSVSCAENAAEVLRTITQWLVANAR